MLIYHRDTKSYREEKEYRQNTLRFLYKTVIGRVLLHIIIARPWFNQISSFYQKSKYSHKDIQPFIDEYQVDAKAEDFETFNDFFTRKREYNTKTTEKELIAIADGKLSVYQISEDLILNIKYSQYTLEELVDNQLDVSDYKNGICLIYRLSVDDYHRYVYCDDGICVKKFFIKGMLHTIRPIASKYKAFSRNCRAVSVLKTKHFGDVIQIEIGAMLIGKIKNHLVDKFNKMDEKGYFEYGGSTIVLLLKDNVKIDEDIVNETQVYIGERIGVLC